MIPLQNSLLVLSNLALLPVIIKLIEVADLIDAFLFTIQMISSIFYHACKDLDSCIIDSRILTFCDVVLATTLIISLTVQYSSCIFNSRSKFAFWHYRKCCDRSDSLFRWDERITLSDINRQIKTIIILILLFINAVWIAIHQTSGYPSLVSVPQKAFALLYSLSMVIYSLYKHIESPTSLVINKRYFVAGLIIGTVGYILFEIASIDSINDYYFITHSLWHILSSLGTYVLIVAIEPAYGSFRGQCECIKIG